MQVRTTSGAVRGGWERGVAVFRGIPYAAAGRFAAPRPAAPWSGVRDATRFGTPPPQPDAVTIGDEWLTLAIWTPDPGRAGLPVLVWISGGAYLKCDTANPHLDGTVLAAGGVVVVSVNYRPGVEGFAHLEGAPDNRGLLDQIAALRWVRENAAAFGGDPADVTVMGQSAGAGAIGVLLEEPDGLFRRAIVQSFPGTFLTPALAGDIAAAITAEIGRSPRAADLVDVAPAELVAAAETITGRLLQYETRWGPVVHTTTPFAPVLDAPPAPGADVPLLIGHTRDEFSLYAAWLPDTDDAAPLIDGLVPTPGAERYRAAYPSLTPARLREEALSDWLFRMPTLRLAEAARAAGADVWLYELCWGFGPRRASHALDTLLVFGTADIEGEISDAGPRAVAEEERLSELMRAEHLAFAATGDPGWPRFPDTRVYDAEPTVGPYPEQRSRDLWRGLRFAAL